MTPAKITIRNAADNDAAGIARVHVDVWKTAYAEIYPKEYLDSLSYQERTGWHKNTLKDEVARKLLIVAETDDREIIGFVWAGKCDGDELRFDAELYAIYILDRYQGQGIGRRLVEKLKTPLVEAGFRSMKLWMAEGNPSGRFYESIGGKLTGQVQSENISGKTIPLVEYGWPDISGLSLQK